MILLLFLDLDLLRVRGVRVRVGVGVRVTVEVRVEVRVRVGCVYMTVSNHLYVCAYTFFVAAPSTSPPVTTITAKLNCHFNYQVPVAQQSPPTVIGYMG